MALRKKLHKSGNSLHLIIDKPILELLGWTSKTLLLMEFTGSRQGLIIRPVVEKEMVFEPMPDPVERDSMYFFNEITKENSF